MKTFSRLFIFAAAVTTLSGLVAGCSSNSQNAAAQTGKQALVGGGVEPPQEVALAKAATAAALAHSQTFQASAVPSSNSTAPPKPPSTQ
jgi:hypothetical protein